MNNIPTRLVLITCMALGSGITTALSVPPPVPISEEELRTTIPYVYGGLVEAYFLTRDEPLRGSGSVIGEHMILTAAHVVFDEENGEWATEVHFYPQFHKEWNYTEIDTQMEGFAVWDEYTDYVENEEFFEISQLDLAVLYSSNISFSNYPPLNILYENSLLNLYTDREKMVLGYPMWTDWMEQFYVLKINDLTMHRFGPRNMWIRQPVINWDETTLGRTYWNFINDRVPGIPRNSGGPIYIQEDDGQWACSGILTRGVATESVYRTLGEDSLELVSLAIESVDDSFMMPCRELSTSKKDSGIFLEWTDSGGNEDGYEIWIQDNLGRIMPKYTPWKLLRKVTENEVSYLHKNPSPGSAISYKVRPFQITTGYTEMNYGPFSPVVQQQAVGNNTLIGDSLGEPLLHWISGGTTNPQAVTEDNGDAAVWFTGVEHSGNAWIETRVMGPGKVVFDFRTSCEKRYDLFEFTANNKWMGTWSGDEPELNKSIQLEEGLNVLRWEYKKDEDFNYYDNRVYLYSVDWIPDDQCEILPGAYEIDNNSTDNLYFAHWFGWYDRSQFPWLFHYNIGWLYCTTEEDGSIFMYSPDSGWHYVAPEIFPWVYSFGKESWILME